VKRVAVALAVALAMSVAGSAALAQTHRHAAPAPPPASIAAAFQLRDVHGRTVTMADLHGRWTLIYFGYSRCTDTCTLAIPSIVLAARKLRGGQIPARAVFVDIETPSGAIRPRDPQLPTTRRGHHVAEGDDSPVVGLQQRFGDELLALTGSRAQLNAATVAFQVRREHVPARPAEKGHSINHTSFIYLATPEGRIVRYFGHDASPEEIVQHVRARRSGS
jgi:protein SCO1/2